jgi:hypothetical protein
VCGEVVRYHIANFILERNRHSCSLEKVDE